MNFRTAAVGYAIVACGWGAVLQSCGDSASGDLIAFENRDAERDDAAPSRGGGAERMQLPEEAGGSEGGRVGGAGAPAGGESPAGGEALTPTALTGPPGAGALGAWVFEEEQFRTYELEVDPTVWANLERDALEEEYVPADLRVEGSSLPGIGVRFKGGWGTLTGCFDADGNRICPKLSVKLDFSEYDRDQRLHGLKRLNFHSMIADPSHMRERLAYRVFREMGLAAPRAAHARLVVNGDDLGVFSLVENVDGRFTKDRFPGGDGNLYKELWPRAAPPERLESALRTNEDAADHSVFEQFHTELALAGAEALPRTLERFMDVDELFAYLAVDRAINNWDGVTAFYCYDEPCENHNFFLYQHEHEPRFTPIPWDLDKTFQLTSPFTDAPDVLEVPADCSVRFHSGPPMMPPGCDPVFRGLALSDRSRYATQLERLLEGPLELEHLESALTRWEAQIESAVESDAHGPGIDAFRVALEELRAALPELRARLIGELDRALTLGE